MHNIALAHRNSKTCSQMILITKCVLYCSKFNMQEMEVSLNQKSNDLQQARDEKDGFSRKVEDPYKHTLSQRNSFSRTEGN